MDQGKYLKNNQLKIKDQEPEEELNHYEQQLKHMETAKSLRKQYTDKLQNKEDAVSEKKNINDMVKRSRTSHFGKSLT